MAVVTAAVSLPGAQAGGAEAGPRPLERRRPRPPGPGPDSRATGPTRSSRTSMRRSARWKDTRRSNVRLLISIQDINSDKDKYNTLENSLLN